MNLPKSFENQMREILGERFELFIREYENEPYKALRVNTLKCNIKMLKKVFNFLEKSTEFCADSYYLPENFKKLGNHPLHHAGAFYIQEPSASAVVEAADIKEGDKVLDLCASPGGKSTQAAAKLNGKGLLVSNEYVQSRVGALVSNIERMGISNAVITSEHPDSLCAKFPNFFDKVIVDAPCSGEGMFRKDYGAVQDWSKENVKTCSERQLKILNSAAVSVKSGGKLIYSTCTYSPEENEMTVERFLKSNPDFEMDMISQDFGEPAIQRFAPDTKNISFARRIFNFNGGEGHFVAVMKRKGESFEQTEQFITPKPTSTTEAFIDFYKECFKGEIPDNVICEGDKVYIIPKFNKIVSLKAIRRGVFAGVFKNERFIPEHALFTCPLFEAVRVINFECDDESVKRFLHGEEIPCEAELKGYVQVRINEIPVGFGKASQGRLKNHYPKGLRTL